MSLRIGGVPFGVGAPLLAGLDERPSVELVRAAPTGLIAELRSGGLDAALVSSVEAFRRPGYRIVDGIAIAARGPVRSVRAFRRPGGPIRTVGLDAGSATSAALLRILLAHRLGAPDPEIRTVEPTLTPDACEEDLVLLIGDCGLNADPGGREVLDLGAEWHAWTGLPFVFALWLLGPGARAEEVVPVLVEARARGRAARVPDGTGGAVHYTMDADERRGLDRFRDEAVAAGLAEEGSEPRFVAGPARRPASADLEGGS